MVFAFLIAASPRLPIPYVLTVTNRFIKTGSNWRIGWDGDAPLYKGLLAGADWALELTAAEFKDFYRLAQQLQHTMQAMASELMDEERLACEAESELIWLEAEGFPQAYSLHLIVLSGRRCEGEWPPEVTAELMTALASLTLF